MEVGDEINLVKSKAGFALDDLTNLLAAGADLNDFKSDVTVTQTYSLARQTTDVLSADRYDLSLKTADQLIATIKEAPVCNFIVGDAEVAIEVKSSETVDSSETRGLRAFSEEHPGTRLIIVSMEQRPRRHKDIEIWPARGFLRKLWADEIIIQPRCELSSDS